MRNFSICACGARKTKYMDKCKKCNKAHMEAIREAAVNIVAKGVCPYCGSKLVRNSALPGWYQCVQYETRKDTHGDPNKPDCSFQCFTE